MPGLCCSVDPFGFDPLGGSRAAEEAEPGASTDAVCPWGRLADGHGALVRCLTRGRGDFDFAGSAARDAGRASQNLPPSNRLRSSWHRARCAALGPRRPGMLRRTLRPTRRTFPAPGPADPSAGKDSAAFTIELGPVVPDTGSLPDAKKSLNKARDRFLTCTKAGGFSPDGGEVELRFLVLGRGRAEGVSVHKRDGVSSAADKCLADVVDRRYVGYPDGPEVGATLVVTMKRK